MSDENLKASLDDIIKNLALYTASVNDPRSFYYGSIAARKVRDALSACREAKETIDASQEAPNKSSAEIEKAGQAAV